MKEQQIKKETKEQRMDKRIEKVQIEKAPGRIRAPEPRSPELQISWLEAAKEDHNWVNKGRRKKLFFFTFDQKGGGLGQSKKSLSENTQIF